MGIYIYIYIYREREREQTLTSYHFKSSHSPHLGSLVKLRDYKDLW